MRSPKSLKLLSEATDTFRELFLLYVGTLLASASAYSLFEHRNFFTSLWWAVVTALTVGYGDIYPVTVGGKVTGIVLMHVVTLFILPLIVARLASKLIANQDKQRRGARE